MSLFPLGERDFPAQVGHDAGEVLGVVLDEGFAREEQFDVHWVVIDGAILEVTGMNGDFSLFDFQLEPGFA